VSTRDEILDNCQRFRNLPNWLAKIRKFGRAPEPAGRACDEKIFRHIASFKNYAHPAGALLSSVPAPDAPPSTVQTSGLPFRPEEGAPPTGVFPVIPVFTSAGSARGKMRQISRASGATRKETEYSVQIPISKVFLGIATLEKTWNKISAEGIVHFFPIPSLAFRQHNSGPQAHCAREPLSGFGNVHSQP